MTLLGLSPGPLNGQVANLRPDLDKLESVGCRSVRSAELWRRFQPTVGGKCDPTALITIAGELHKREMTLVSGLSSRDDRSFDYPAEYAVAFGELCRVLADLPNVVCAQTFNEPEHLKCDQNPTPARWVEAQKRAFEAAQKAAPDVLVCTGGLGGMEADWAPNKTCADFLAESYRLGLQGSFHLLAEHPYSAPFTIKQSIKEGRKGGYLLRECRRLMKANGDGDKQILCSEHGVPTGGPNNPYTEDGQAAWMRNAHAWLSKHDYVHSAYWFTLQDHAEIDVDEHGNPNDSGDFMGVLRKDGSRKKSADMFQSLAAA